MSGRALKLLALVRDEEALEQVVQHADRTSGANGSGPVELRRPVAGPPVPEEFRSAHLGRAPVVAVLTVPGWSGRWGLELPEAAAEVYLVEESPVFARRTRFDAHPGSGDGFTRIGSQSRAPGLSRPDFVEHWRRRHAPLVERHQPGISRYIQNAVVEQLAGADLGVDGFHESTFPTEDAYRRGIFDSPAGRAALAHDTTLLLKDPHQEERLFVRERATDVVTTGSRW